MNTNVTDSGHANGFYLAEGETPDDLPIVLVGTQKLVWRERRSQRNHFRHLRCAGRTGAKIIDGDDGLIVIETAT